MLFLPDQFKLRSESLFCFVSSVKTNNYNKVVSSKCLKPFEINDLQIEIMLSCALHSCIIRRSIAFKHDAVTHNDIFLIFCLSRVHFSSHYIISSSLQILIFNQAFKDFNEKYSVDSIKLFIESFWISYFLPSFCVSWSFDILSKEKDRSIYASDFYIIR